MTEPTTEAGRRLGVDVEQELGVQFKSADAYHGWLATANALASAIEAEARAAEREYQVAVRKDWGTLPHGEFRQKYGGLDRALYLLPTNCSCRECQMWAS